MSTEFHGEQINLSPEAGLSENTLEKARESVIRAEKARELAYAAAIKARESAARSAHITKELDQEAKRKAKAAQIAALKAKMETKLAARIIKEAKVTKIQETRNNGTVQGKNRQNDAASNMTKETKWLSSELFEGRVEILLLSANTQQIYSLAEVLRSIQNLRVEYVSGSEEGGSRIAILVVQPVPLLDILAQIPAVDEVTQFDWREIELSLKKE